MTHYRSAQDLRIFRGKPARIQRALCLELFLYPDEWSAQPSCQLCQQEAARFESLDVG